ncbi:MAG: trypsin-like peptidase domain-containing protein, partial [Dolichospermum sp.]
MRLINGLAATVIGVTVILVQPQNTAALDGQQINNIAKQITVKIDGQNQGTGIIVNKAGNRYTVLTNHHVVREKGKYILITPDGKKYNFNSSDIKKLPNLDLAIVQFISNDNYTVATLGDSNKLTESTPIYNAGWSVNDTLCLKGCYRFYDGIINGISPNPQEGYALIISNNTLPGMSGGPILNAQGELVGINGLSVSNGNSRAVDFAGIPINEYKKYQNIFIVSQPTPTPQPNPDNTFNFTLAQTLTDHSDDVNSVAWSPNGRTLASGSSDKTIKIWDGRTGNLLRTLSGHSDSVLSVAWSPDGRTLASGSWDKTIKIWDGRTGNLLRTLSGHSYSVWSVAWSPDGRTLASGSSDETIKIWDGRTG